MTDFNGTNPVSVGFTGKASQFARVFNNTKALQDGGVALDFLRIGQGAAPVPAASEGTIYFDTATQKFKKSENGGVFSTLGGLDLLHAELFTNTSGSADNASTYAFGAGALTAKDWLVIPFSIYAASAGTVSPVLYSVTDSLELIDLSGDGSVGYTIGAGETLLGEVLMGQRPDSATKLVAHHRAGFANGANKGYQVWVSLTTPWTSAWTLAMRTQGISGGTIHVNWGVYRKPGQ